MAFLVVICCNVNGWSQLPLHPDRGMVVQVGEGEGIPENLPDAVGTIEVGYTWQELEKGEDRYEFAELEGELKEIAEKGWKVFIKVKTSSHPDYLFSMVPYLEESTGEGFQDHSDGYGVPMFWHSGYRDRYARLLYNLGLHLRRLEEGESVLGIIPDLGFILSDHISTFAELAKDTSNWILPGNTRTEDLVFWTDGTWSGQLEYLHEVHRRAGSGVGWMYQRSTGIQPGNPQELKMANIFVNQCKNGEAFGYAWSQADRSAMEGNEAQFFHWSVLYNLQSGASFMSVPEKYTKDTSYMEDIKLFNKYAGSVSQPDTTPGIWIAFREGDRMKGDFAIGIERNTALPSKPLKQTGQGKYGLWGRKIEPMSTIRLKMDKDFLESLHPKLKISIRVWYLDDDRSVFRVHAFNGIHPIQKTGSGEWKMAEIRRRPLIQSQMVDLVSLNGPLTVHMIEIARYGY